MNLGMLARRDVSGDVLAACGRSYDFGIDELTTVEVEATARSGAIAVSIVDNAGATLSTVNVPAGGSVQLRAAVDVGGYALKVSTAAAAKTSFQLKLSSSTYDRKRPDDDPGQDPDSALAIGPLTEVRRFGGYVGVSDSEDYYAFDLEKNGTVTIATSEVTSPAVVQVFAKAALIDKSKPLVSLSAPATMDSLLKAVLEHGTYFVRVAPSTSSGSGLYTLALEASLYDGKEPATEPGKDRDGAYNVGKLDDLVEYAGYVGPTDSDDYYHFDLPDNVSVTFAMSDLHGSLQGQLFKDAPLIDVANPLLDIRSTGADQLRTTNLAKGAYVFRVTFLNNLASLYTLSLHTDRSQ